MKKYKKVLREEIIIKLSSTFYARSTCWVCRGKPLYYYRIEEERLYKDHKKDLLKFNYIKKNCLRMCENDQFLGAPSKYNDVSFLKFSTSFKKYNPKLHHTRGLKSSNYKEYLVCECGNCAWSFCYKSNSKRKEISQRQSAYFYPPKFDY